MVAPHKDILPLPDHGALHGQVAVRLVLVARDEPEEGVVPLRALPGVPDLGVFRIGNGDFRPRLFNQRVGPFEGLLATGEGEGGGEGQDEDQETDG